MSLRLAILLCVLPLSPLLAIDAGPLMKACGEAQIVLVIQTWSPDGRADPASADRPGFDDSVMDVFKDKTAKPDAVTEKLIEVLAPPLAKQGFHIFRTAGLLWIAPQGAPPLFGMSLRLEENTTWNTDAMVRAFATGSQGSVQPAIMFQRGVITPTTITLEPGEYSLARAMSAGKISPNEVLGWYIHSFEAAGPNGLRQAYFSLRPVLRKVYWGSARPSLSLR